MKAIVTVVGKDQVGIIADVCILLAKEGVNVLDISQTILDGFFNMVMVVDMGENNFSHISKLLEESGKPKGLSIRVQREDIFNAMHRI